MFSLRMLLTVVTLSAVYIAGIVYRTGWWVPSILTLTYLIYAGAITAAILSREHRAFFVAFAVFGFAYVLCNYSQTELVTDRLLRNFALSEVRARTDAQMQEQIDAMEQTGPGYPGQLVPGRVIRTNGNPLDNFARDLHSQIRSIGHSFFAVLISFVAGVVAEAVVRRKPQSLSSAANPAGAD